KQFTGSNPQTGTLTMQADYTYDALGNRQSKAVTQNGTTTTTRFTYDGSDVWADMDNTNTMKVRYLHGDAVDQLFGRYDATNGTAWYIQDHLGSVRDIVNTSGTLLDAIAYDPFGKVTSETNSSFGERYGFTGTA